MQKQLAPYKSVADAVARLFHPYAEVVIHDIEQDAVYYIANPCSGRSPGDASLLKLDANRFDLAKDVIGPYEKAGDQGQAIRSITAALRSAAGRPIGILCINLDFAPMESALEVLEGLIRPPHVVSPPEVLFRNDWRDLIKLEIKSFLSKTSGSLDTLSAGRRISLLKQLEQKGLFYARKSVEQVAAILGVSRATVYKDLSSIRKKPGKA